MCAPCVQVTAAKEPLQEGELAAARRVKAVGGVQLVEPVASALLRVGDAEAPRRRRVVLGGDLLPRGEAARARSCRGPGRKGARAASVDGRGASQRRSMREGLVAPDSVQRMLLMRRIS